MGHLRKQGNLESRMRLKLHVRFGGEGLVRLGNQDLAPYPTQGREGACPISRSGGL